ncbi:MAG: DUF3570 domain-containing protein [Spongiibacteraceae bacterium]|nr:DUF3570 domain-containing protein [Spongiibacteraceae bacterium]
MAATDLLSRTLFAPRTSRARARCCAALVALLMPALSWSAVLPDDRIDVLYHGYDGGGAQIDGPSVLVRKQFANKVSVYANYYVDMVSSASIDVLATASEYTEERKEYSVGADYLRDKTTISASFTKSDESDYTAETMSFSISQDFFGDLSTLTLGFSKGDDEVRNNADPDFKDTIDRRQYRIELSQILTRSWIVSLAAETVVDEGFLNNPYRSVRYLDAGSGTGYSYQQEIYPGTRNSDAFALRSKYFLPWRAALSAEFRHFSDSWGIEAFNGEISYLHPFKNGVTLELRYREYQQDAADFYSDLFAFQNAQNFMARDKELSTYTSTTYGLGASYEINLDKYKLWGDRIRFSLYWDHMEFRYDDFRNVLVGGTPGSEPLYSFDADVYRAFVSLWY